MFYISKSFHKRFLKYWITLKLSLLCIIFLQIKCWIPVASLIIIVCQHLSMFFWAANHSESATDFLSTAHIFSIFRNAQCGWATQVQHKVTSIMTLSYKTCFPHISVLPCCIDGSENINMCVTRLFQIKCDGGAPGYDKFPYPIAQGNWKFSWARSSKCSAWMGN